MSVSRLGYGTIQGSRRLTVALCLSLWTSTGSVPFLNSTTLLTFSAIISKAFCISFYGASASFGPMASPNFFLHSYFSAFCI